MIIFYQLHRQAVFFSFQEQILNYYVFLAALSSEELDVCVANIRPLLTSQGRPPDQVCPVLVQRVVGHDLPVEAALVAYSHLHNDNDTIKPNKIVLLSSVDYCIPVVMFKNEINFVQTGYTCRPVPTEITKLEFEK